ncbi:hypothetical protein Daus18300_001408 [Diaporthe australafricana]|uniref:Uncharacterized protein n=1 Tax=Diaporthe australafricana TaxID=127596 RepID=A0ABR3XVL0_9PEZI
MYEYLFFLLAALLAPYLVTQPHHVTVATTIATIACFCKAVAEYHDAMDLQVDDATIAMFALLAFLSAVANCPLSWLSLFLHADPATTSVSTRPLPLSQWFRRRGELVPSDFRESAATNTEARLRSEVQRLKDQLEKKTRDLEEADDLKMQLKKVTREKISVEAEVIYWEDRFNLLKDHADEARVKSRRLLDEAKANSVQLQDEVNQHRDKIVELKVQRDQSRPSAPKGTSSMIERLTKEIEGYRESYTSARDQISELFATLTKKDEIIADKDKQIRVQTGLAKMHEFGQKSLIVGNDKLMEDMRDLKSEVDRAQSIVFQRDTVICSKEGVIASQHDLIAQQHNELKEKDEEIARLKAIIESRPRFYCCCGRCRLDGPGGHGGNGGDDDAGDDNNSGPHQGGNAQPPPPANEPSGAPPCPVVGPSNPPPSSGAPSDPAAAPVIDGAPGPQIPTTSVPDPYQQPQYYQGHGQQQLPPVATDPQPWVHEPSSLPVSGLLPSVSQLPSYPQMSAAVPVAPWSSDPTNTQLPGPQQWDPQGMAHQLPDHSQLSASQVSGLIPSGPQFFEPSQVSEHYLSGYQGFEPHQSMPQDMVPQGMSQQNMDPQSMAPQQWMSHEMVPQNMASDNIAPQGMAHQFYDPRQLLDPQMLGSQFYEPTQISGPYPSGPQEFEPQQWMPQNMVPQNMDFQNIVPQGMDPNQWMPQAMVPQDMIYQNMASQQLMPQAMDPQNMAPLQWMPQEMVPQDMDPQQLMPQALVAQDMVPQYVAGQLLDPRQLSYPQPEMPASFSAAPQVSEPTQQSGPSPSDFQGFESHQSAPQDWVSQEMIPQDMAQDMAGQLSGPPQLLPSSQLYGPQMPDSLPSALAQLSAPDVSGSQGFESHESPPQATSGQLPDPHQLPPSSQFSAAQIPDALPSAPEPSAPSKYSASEQNALQAFSKHKFASQTAPVPAHPPIWSAIRAFASYGLAGQASAVAPPGPEQAGPNQSGQEASTYHQYAPQASAALENAPPQLSQSSQPSYNQPLAPQSGFVGSAIAPASHQPEIRADVDNALMVATASLQIADRHDSVTPQSNQFEQGHTQINPQPSYQQPAPPAAPAPAAPVSPVDDDEDDDNNDLLQAIRETQRRRSHLKVGPMQWMPAKKALDIKALIKKVKKAQKMSKKRLISRKDPLGEITAHMELDKTKNLYGFIGGEWKGRPERIYRWIDRQMQAEVQRHKDEYSDVLNIPVPNPNDPRLVPLSQFATNPPAPAAPVVNNATAATAPAVNNYTASAAPGGTNGAGPAPGSDDDDGPELPRGWAVGEEDEDDDSSAPSSATTTQQSSAQAASPAPDSITTLPSTTSGAASSSTDGTSTASDPATGINQMMSNMSIAKRGRDDDDNADNEEMAKRHRTTQAQDSPRAIAAPRRSGSPGSSAASLSVSAFGALSIQK